MDNSARKTTDQAKAGSRRPYAAPTVSLAVPVGKVTMGLSLGVSPP